MKKLAFSIIGLITAFVISLGVGGSSTVASNAPTQFTIPDTTLVVSGFASPGALVQIYDGGSLIGTVVANNQGGFSKEFLAMDAGLHKLRLQYEDKNGLLSDAISDTVNLVNQQATAVEYFLPPTINIIPTTVTEGNIVSFSGSTVPGATIEIKLDGGNIVVRPQSAADGTYSIAVNTSGYYAGEHPVIAKTLKGNQSSYSTIKRTFTVTPVSVTRDTAPRTLEPPVITSPSSPHVTDNQQQLVRGIALPNVQVIVYLDGVPIGSTFSSNEGNWFFNLDIQSRRHEVRAIQCIDNNCSDFSNILEIIFEGEFGKCGFTFQLADYRYWGVRLNDGIDLTFINIHGAPPYEMIVDWGDTTVERFNRDDSESFNLHHVYDEIGQFNGNVTVIDRDGCQHTRYFSVDVVEHSFDWRWLLILIPLALAILLALIIHDRQNHQDSTQRKTAPKS